jgi:hypothetical protein
METWFVEYMSGDIWNWSPTEWYWSLVIGIALLGMVNRGLRRD